MNNKLLDLLKFDSDEIELSFEKASIEGKGTPQEISDRRESSVVSIFLSKYFPFPYRITKGNIIDSYGENSNSIDCLILSPSHPYTIDPKNNRASIIFADGVDFAIEIKPDLSNEKELFRSLDQIRSVKRLTRKRNGLITIKDKPSKIKIDYSYKIPCVIFASKTYSDIRTLILKIVDYYIENDIPKLEQFDLIVVNKRCIIVNSNFDSYGYITEQPGIVFLESGNLTLATWLLWMNYTTKSEPALSSNILTLYLSFDELFSKVKGYEDLMKKYNDHFNK